jgi:hypothetical protein
MWLKEYFYLSKTVWHMVEMWEILLHLTLFQIQFCDTHGCNMRAHWSLVCCKNLVTSWIKKCDIQRTDGDQHIPYDSKLGDNGFEQRTEENLKWREFNSKMMGLEP